ncbi:MAG TPA: helicase-related protein [Candidatus Paceibacterota bacterium]|nr:helicase-related protein [Candidatus Paceibacterota bacterium]
MAHLEELKVGTVVRGLAPSATVTIKHIEMFGDQVANVTYVDAEGRPGTQLVYRDQESSLEIVHQNRPFSFTAGGQLFRLVSEAQRLKLAFLFDPLIAVSTSDVQPLPHQITAVYETMLDRRPLRFLLADDPGAGKTIMTGLLIKELLIRGDVAKCLIVAPGSLVEQWQDELDQKFNLSFDILTNEGLQAARTGNWFQEHSLCICRLDKLSRNDDIQEKLATIDWDLVVVDEAHKMSAHFFGGELKETKRFKLGKLLSQHTRQFLLLTATPHSGKEEDFQLFLSLLDGDRFEGRFRDGVHAIDCTDLMRRMVKEQLVTMEGKPLFPERFAYTVPYPLSPEEAALYKGVTDYVREEFNRAERLENENRKGTVGFALTILQRRLASSPEAILQSLRRRRERLEERLREERLLRRGAKAKEDFLENGTSLTDDDIDDLEEAPEQEMEAAEEQIVDQATAARTITELEAEIHILRDLESEALKLRRSCKDTKWQKLSETLLENPEMFDANKNRRKLVIFTEQRDTLNYLVDRLTTLLGNPSHLVSIHGQTPRERRRQIQESFMSDPEVLILVATDAAAEGINLQRGHLMVNYDLPWNPNRIEQRFGRIHRIGQRDVCHLWNLVAQETREGEVFLRLLRKIEQQCKALHGAVFDVLGKVFEGAPLRELLIEAIRYGERAETKAKLDQVIQRLDTEHLRDLVYDRLLVQETMDASRVQEIRDHMERAQARKLQPHYIGSFFAESFAHFGGQLSKREPLRYEIRHVPAEIRQRDRVVGSRAPILRAYERVTFHKEAIRVEGKPPAALVAPGHPLLDSTVDLVLEKYRDFLRQGAVLVDTADPGTESRVLFYLEHSICDGRQDANRNSLTISRQLQFVEICQDGRLLKAGYAPYLDYTPATPEQSALVEKQLAETWLKENLEQKATSFAIQYIVPQHLREVTLRREAHITKTMRQVKERLTREINYWDHRANELKAREDAGKSRSNLNSANARQRADKLAERLRLRMAELELERKIVARPPTVLGGALVVPAGCFSKGSGDDSALRETPPPYGNNINATEKLAIDKVLEAERKLGFEPRDVSAENRGYDIESRDPMTGSLRFIEVKGRVEGAAIITVTKNEILTAFNRPDAYILAVVLIGEHGPEAPYYLTQPFNHEPEFATASVNFRLSELLEKADQKK